MVTNYANFGEVISALHEINQEIEIVRQAVVSGSGIHYVSQDIRHVALDGMQRDISACAMWITSMMSLKKTCQDRFGSSYLEHYRQAIGTGIDSGRAEDFMLDLLRRSLSTQTASHIQALLGGLAFAVCKQPVHCESVCQAIIALDLSIDVGEFDSLRALELLVESQKTNGIHVGDGFHFSIGTEKISFIKGQEVQCAGWSSLLHILHMAINSLGNILGNDPVKGQRSVILTPYKCR